MSGIDFAALMNNDNSANASGGNTKSKPDAMIWANIGFDAEMPVFDENGQKTGQTETVFISLPYGVPLDTMNPASTKSSNKQWAARQDAKNRLLANLLQAAQAKNPGESFDAIGLKVQVRRASESVQVEEDTDLSVQIPTFA